MEKIELLKKYDRAYEEGNPLVSDLEYDDLKERTKSEFPTASYFETVGSDVGSKVTLPFIMGSLKKLNVNTIDKWIKKINDDIVISAKMDGVSIICTWDGGVLESAYTRGNGYEGQDITEKAKYFVSKYIAYKKRITLRGECLLDERYAELGFKNKRSGVAGMLNRDDINAKELNYITVLFYEIVDMEDMPDTEIMRFDKIARIGLLYPWYDIIEVKKLSNIPEYMKNKLTLLKNAAYDIDGIVITKNKSERESVFYPENKVAFKVNMEFVKTTVESIEWNTGRTKRITPTVLVSPTTIGGVTIRRVTGFNADYISLNNIGIDTTLNICRSGDVIPFISEILEPTGCDIPKVCPSCGSKTFKSGVDIVCKNPNCHSSLIKQIAHFFKTLGSDYITETTVENLNVNSINEMYELEELDIAGIDGFGIKKAEQIYHEIQKTLKTRPELLLAAFGISGIGKTLAPVILEQYTFDELFDTDNIDGVDGVGDILSENLVNNINDFKDLYIFMKGMGLEFMKKDTTSSVNGKVFAITGVLPLKRNEVIKMITNKGGIVKSMSKGTNYLITDDTESGSVKNKKALEMGTEVISFDELITILN